MNETLEKIMIFINENTNILIGICLFLIFVLLAYLIDNSIKSKKAKKAFENSRKEDAEISSNNLNEVKEELNENKNITDEINDNLFENEPIMPDMGTNEVLDKQDASLDIPNDATFEDAVINDNENTIQPELSDLNDVVSAIDSVNVETENISLPIEDEVAEENNADVIYRNDKKLSDILFSDMNKEEQSEQINLNEISNNIFDENNNPTEDIKPKNVEPKVEIELDENELDNIMKKLKSVSSVDEEDNYTNIF